MEASKGAGGLEALRRLHSAGPPAYLSPSPDLSRAARLASQYTFSLLRPFSPKSPFDSLLVNGFDAEQIWQQIDLLSQPLMSILRREVKKFDKNPEEVARLFGEVDVTGKEKKGDLEPEEEGFGGLDEMEDDLEGFDDEEDEDEEGEDKDKEEEEDDEGEEKDEEEEENEEGEENGPSEDGGGDGGVEDKFFKINELEEYLEEDEAREYGLKKKKEGDNNVSREEDNRSEEDEEEEEDEDEEEEDDELGVLGVDIDDEEAEELENARYEDFFGTKKKNNQKRKPKMLDGSGESDMDDGIDEAFKNQKRNLSVHEKEQEKFRSKIEQLEKANLEPKTWIMRGEATSAIRPKNSALEVDLDFKHNIRPAPVITEEVTASLEELIKKRILEGNFDDVQKAPSLPSKAPKEFKELDENKSKRGLAEIYEEEYVQKTGLVSSALSFSDEQKQEASMLFKKLCLKLDALSHFHFTPKPVVEDMSVQTNVPALAMEEIAPVAVSDAAMLAPEEVFAGKGDIKEEPELTQADRKRRRAKKKRKFKAEEVKRTAMKKARQSASQNRDDGREES